MSLKTWKKEFYPKEAIDAIKTELMATKHSLRKWRGLTKANLKKHGLVQTGDFIHKKNNQTRLINIYKNYFFAIFHINSNCWIKDSATSKDSIEIVMFSSLD